jgi:hypothetical protein
VAFTRQIRFAAIVAALCTGAGLGALAGAPAPAHAALLNDAPVPSPTFNGSVYSVVFGGETVFVGGTFTTAYSAGKSYPRSRLAAFNARTGALLDWKPAADAAVRAVAFANGTVYAAGAFSTINGVKRDSIAAMEASTGALRSFKHGINGLPRALGVGNGRLYVAGRLTLVDGQARKNLAAFSLATGLLDPSWRPTADDTVESLAVTDDRVYLGGFQRVVNGVSGYAKLTAVSATDGALVRAFQPKLQVVAHAVTVNATTVYVGLGGQGGKVIAYNLDGSQKWMATFDGDVQAITELGGMVYTGGHFDNICATNNNGDQGACTDGSIPRVKFAAFSPAGVLQSWAPSGNGIVGVRTMAASESLGRIAAGGDFTLVNNTQWRRLAVFAL